MELVGKLRYTEFILCCGNSGTHLKGTLVWILKDFDWNAPSKIKITGARKSKKGEKKRGKERRRERKERSWKIMEHHGTPWIIIELRIECRLIMIDP